MDEEEKTTPAEGEAATDTQTKKEGKISGFFKKVGQKLDDATYDARLASDFAKHNAAYKIYTGTGIFAANPEISAEEHTDGDEKYIIMLGEDENAKPGNMIKKVNGNPVYHIAAVEPATLTIEFEGKTNERAATKITFGEPAEEVAVIKVEDKFYKA